MQFALFKLFLNKDDRVALRYLVGINSSNFHAGAYARLRAHCEDTGDTPFDALDKMAAGILKLPHTKVMVTQFDRVKKLLADLESFRENLPGLVESNWNATYPF